MITCKFRLAFPDENHLTPIHGCSGSGGSQATTSGALLIKNPRNLEEEN